MWRNILMIKWWIIKAIDKFHTSNEVKLDSFALFMTYQWWKNETEYNFEMIGFLIWVRRWSRTLSLVCLCSPLGHCSFSRIQRSPFLLCGTLALCVMLPAYFKFWHKNLIFSLLVSLSVRKTLYFKMAQCDASSFDYIIYTRHYDYTSFEMCHSYFPFENANVCQHAEGKRIYRLCVIYH